jgi:hypothetical protein
VTADVRPLHRRARSRAPKLSEALTLYRGPAPGDLSRSASPDALRQAIEAIRITAPARETANDNAPPPGAA